MPVVSSSYQNGRFSAATERSNNRILAANARAADVAEFAVNGIMPVMQQRYYDAFRVQGVEGILYTQLTNGRPCTCVARGKRISGLLNEQGKASVGDINSMLTGSFQFNVTPYNQNQQRVVRDPTITSPYDSRNRNQGVFDIAVPSTADVDDIPFADLINGNGFGDNGPVLEETVNQVLGDMDTGLTGYADSSCPICFGSNFIGGYTPYKGHRQVLVVTDVQVRNGELDMLSSPMRAHCTGFDVQVILPRGAQGIDALRVWDGEMPMPALFTVDGTAVTSNQQFLGFCDGKPHIIGASNFSNFTHFELQFVLSDESVYFEFPRRPSNSNTALLEQDDPFNIIFSPNTPQVSSKDIIVERQLGKHLIVQNANPWNSRNRNTLDFQANVRVLQPQEIYRLLPVRARVMTKPQTTLLSRDNVIGIRRT